MPTIDAVALPFDDTADFDDAERGFIATGEPGDPQRRGRGGLGQRLLHDFLDRRRARHACTRACGGSASWCAKQGLFEVTDGIYQVRGFDLSNMTLRRGRHRRHRHRPADLHRDRRRGAGAVPRAPRRPAGRRA